MKPILILSLAALSALAQPTNLITSAHLGVLVNRTNSQVISPADFWAANSNAISGVVPAPPSPFIDASNIVSGVIAPALLPPPQTQWPWEAITNRPEFQSPLGFAPATNSPAGIMAALGFVPASNGVALSSESIIAALGYQPATNGASSGGGTPNGSYTAGAANYSLVPLHAFQSTNYYLDFSQAFQRIDCTEGVAFRFSTNWPGTVSTGTVTTIFVSPTNITRRLAIYDAATNWGVAGLTAPMVVPGNCSVTLRAIAWGPGETNVTVTAVMHGSTVSFDHYTAFHPLSIPTCVLWLDAARGVYQSAWGTNASANGSYVRFWADQSGNANHLTNLNAVNVYKTGAGPSAYPCVTFTANNPNTTMRSRGFALPKPVTAFVVFNNRLGNPQGVFDANNGNMLFGVSGSQWQAAGGNALNIPNNAFPVGKFSQATVLFNGAFSQVRTNGALCVSGDLGQQPSDGFAVGGFGISDYYAMNGDICELIIYNSALTPANISAVESYLLTKYGPLPQ